MSSIVYEIIDNDTALKIDIVGRFDYSSHGEFKASYNDKISQVTRVEVHLSRTNYMDSTALGMLLLLRERAGGDQANISLHGANTDILRILKTSFFDKIFTIK